MVSPDPTWLPSGFHAWMPAVQAATIGVLTFVQEDVPTVGAALLAAAGSLTWWTAFWGCFLGIWLGDALLYGFARWAGRLLLLRPWASRFINEQAVARSEVWFARRGAWLLLSSRFVPGTRLPTYVAAGFLRLPLARFLVITGTAVGIWVIAIFGLAAFVGARLSAWLQHYGAGGWLMPLAILLAIVALRLGSKLTQQGTRQRLQARLGRWRRWEFWPPWLFYIPVVLNYLWLGLRYRGFTLPSAANPGIFAGGAVGESKFEILRDLRSTSPKFTIETHLLPGSEKQAASPEVRTIEHSSSGAALFNVDTAGLGKWSEAPWEAPKVSKPRIRTKNLGGTSSASPTLLKSEPRGTRPSEPRGSWEDRLQKLETLRQQHQIDYPFILKPDMGQRGVGVKVIQTAEQAEKYLRQVHSPLLLQRYVPGPCEAGIFYYRFPGEPRGHIFAITEKLFPTLTGDGQHTIEELVWRDSRARFLAEKYLTRFESRRHEVLAAGQTVRLVEVGNHAQGCIFRDGKHLFTEELEGRIDEISQKLSGFFIGRYDIRYASADDLQAGRNFQIIELNGATSEATNIYDSRHSILDAYRILFRQWNLVFAIGAENRRRGVEALGLRLLWQKWRENALRVASYPLAD